MMDSLWISKCVHFFCLSTLQILLLFTNSLDTDSNSYVPTMRDITRSLTSKTQNDDEIICAGDLILCWDGTIVSRDPENHCHLSACPEFSWSGVLRTPLVSLLAFVQRLVLAFLDFLPRCGVLCDVYFSFLALGETK